MAKNNNNNMKAKNKAQNNMEVGTEVKAKVKGNAKMDLSNMEIGNDMNSCKNNNRNK